MAALINTTISSLAAAPHAATCRDRAPLRTGATRPMVRPFLSCSHRRMTSHFLVRAEKTAAEQMADQDFEKVPGSEKEPQSGDRYTVELLKPLGIVLEEGKDGGIYVADVLAGSNSDGKVNVGDELISTSGVSYTRETQYGEANVKSGERAVKMPVRGEDFRTVMAAITSNPARRPVSLEFKRGDKTFTA